MLGAGVVEGCGAEVHLAEVNSLEVEAADSAVLHRAEIEPSALEVGGYCPLGGTGDVGEGLALGKLNADGDVEVVEDMERLHYGLSSRG